MKKYYIKNVVWFTLIELIVTISIIAMLVLVVYAPYNFYQKIEKIKLTTRNISQLLNDININSISWYSSNWKNNSLWVYFSNEVWQNNTIKVFSYSYDIDIVDITNTTNNNIQLFKTLKLDDNIIIKNIDNYDNMLFYYNAVTGEVVYYNFNQNWKTLINKNKLKINIWYMNTSISTLNKSLEFITDSKIIFYK
jgi:prepilin-type N-terminal cleavage/methylation domain-containing protein